LILTLLLCFSLAMTAAADIARRQVTVLFIHDLHSHFLPATDENGDSYGGYARLKTVIDQQKALHPDALVVDGGDFSMGSLFQVSFRSSAAELRVMGKLGVDATTFGNHEYDCGPDGLAEMLNAAADSGDTLPAIVETNFLPKEDADEVLTAFDRCNVQPYLLLERGGVHFAVVSAFGVDAEDCAPTADMVRTDPIAAVQAAVDAANDECLQKYGEKPVVICLSHSGTSGQEGEDVDLAAGVIGIHLIISGHTHSTLQTPILENGTYIVSCGEYSKNLGSITLDLLPDNTVTLAEYQLLPVDDTVTEDKEMKRLIEGYKAEVEQDYLSLFDLGFDQVLVNNPYRLDSVGEVYATQHESTLCNIFSDAYKWAAEQATGQPVDVALTAAGVIRETLPQGDVTVSDVFTAASLGDGASDVPGGAIISIWLTGSDLKNVLEVDASVQPIMSAAQLFCSGVEYTQNTYRVIFNKVEAAALRKADGTTQPIQDDQLYRVVTGTYAGNMLGSVKEKSFGLLSVTPRDENGTPVQDLSEYIIHNPDGSELKEWYAISSYLQTMDGVLDEKYASPDGRKNVITSLNPSDLLRNANKFTVIAIALVLVIVAAAILIIRAIRRDIKKHKSDRRYLGKVIRYK